jgi:hypothetical protein
MTLRNFEKQEKPQSARCGWGDLGYGCIEALALDDLAGLDAAGANADALRGALDDGLDRLQVHVPATPGGVVGVGDVVAELRSLAAKITFLSHDLLQSFVAELPCAGVHPV